MTDYETNTLLPRPVPTAFVPFCTDAIPEPIQSYIRGGAKAMGCEDSYVALPLLAALAAAIGNTRRIQLKKIWSEPAVLWTGIIGDSGTLKSPAVDLALKPLRKIQNVAFDAYEEKLADYQKELADYEMRKMRRKKTETPLEKPVEPVAKRYICSDITVEALAALLKQNPRGLLLVRDELAGWIKGFNSYKGGRGGDETAFLELHRAATLLVDRKSGVPKTIHVPNAAVSLCGGIQPKVLQQTLGRENFENGLAARILMAKPPKMPKQWNEHDTDPETASQVEAVFAELLRMQMVMKDDGGFVPKVLGLMPEAKDAWIDFYNEHGQQQSELDGDLAAAFSKLEGYAARLALVIHCVRAADGDTTLVSDDYIDAESIERAVRIVRWFCDETRRIYAMFGESDEQAEQRKLLEIVRSQGGRITVRQLMQASRSYRGDANMVRFALEELQLLGWGRLQKVDTGGRPSEIFVLDEADDNPRQERAE